MACRTDLALEKTTSKRQQKIIDGLTINRGQNNNSDWVTVEAPLINGTVDGDCKLRQIISKELTSMLPKNGLILIAGLGNRDITPDALGCLSAERIFATRHLKKEMLKQVGFGELRPVAVIQPGVLGCTGIETAEFLLSITKKLVPSAVIAIDALAAGRLYRIGKTVQISAGGISPGSGIGNNRPQISKELLGVPVIGIGIPTVVDAATLCSDLCDCEPADVTKMMVTPRDIDNIVSRSAHLIASSINCALNPQIEPEIFEQIC